MLLTVGGTRLTITVIGILYYAKYRRAWAGTTTNTKKRNPPSKNDIEISTLHSMTNDQVTKYLGHIVTESNLEPELPTSRATPLLIQKKPEDEFGINFNLYEKYKKCKQEMRKGSECLNSVV